jgi:hypothetical protein
MAPIARIAAADIPNLPELSPLRMPRGKPTAEKLASFAYGMGAAAAPFADTFTKAGLGADFVAQLSAAADAVVGVVATRRQAEASGAARRTAQARLTEGRRSCTSRRTAKSAQDDPPPRQLEPGQARHQVLARPSRRRDVVERVAHFNKTGGRDRCHAPADDAAIPHGSVATALGAVAIRNGAGDDARCSGRDHPRDAGGRMRTRVRGGPNVWVVRFGPRFSVTEEGTRILVPPFRSAPRSARARAIARAGERVDRAKPPRTDRTATATG